MRLNKFISDTGVCSRRVADQWIDAGRVTVNGAVVTLGTQVESNDDIRVDGQPLKAKPAHVYIALNKPVGITCTTEADVPDNIVAFIAHRERIFPVGRLDKDSEGLILLTNNGDIVNQILRAERAHEKEYEVTVDKPVTDAFLKAMAGGVRILGTLTKPCRTKRLASTTFQIVLTQGLNRQIRRMCSALDYRVRNLKRVRIMHIQLGKLPTGRWRDLTSGEVAALLAQCAGQPATKR